MSNRPTFQIQRNEKYIVSQLFQNIIDSSTVSKAFLEEPSSELWYETKNGTGNTIFKNKITYEGFMKYGILHNENPEEPCSIQFPDGTTYTGTIINNEITGEGKYVFEDGSTYEGEVLNGLRHGKGIFKSKNGIYYEGEWKNGLKNGKGKIIQGNMELEGEWKNDILNGKCRIKWKSGNIFDGILQNNKMNGNGYLVWYNKNEKYTGMWKDNLQNGYGIYIWYDSKNENKFFRDRYVGEWKEGKRNGYGRFYYSNGNIYEGYWKNNMKEGFGIMYYNDRSKYIGSFKNDNIYEVNDKKKKEDSKKKNKNNNKDKKISRINRNIDEIKLNISINDIINSEIESKNKLKELDNIILRNLSLITHLYLYACGKEEIKTIDIGTSTIAASLSEAKPNRASRKSTRVSAENSLNNLKQSELPSQQPEKKTETNIDYDNVYNNNFYFCLDFNHFWKLIRECGLINLEISLAMIDRICFQNPDNNIEMFYIPDNLINKTDHSCLEEEKEIIYNYLYQKIEKSKMDFENKYRKNIKQSHSIIYGEMKNDNEKEKNTENKLENDVYFDCHDGKNIILLRYFYEIIIRIAHIKYNNPEMTIYAKTKKLLEEMKLFLKTKVKSGNIDNIQMASILMLDPKLKNIELTFAKFMSEYKLILFDIFNELYESSCDNENIYNSNDKTITYRFFYDNIISNSEPLLKIFEEKLEYIDIISIYIKDKKVNSYNYSTVSKIYSEDEIMEYVDNLLDNEMIFYEFCELIFFISRKYFIFYGLNKDDEMNTINTNNKSQSMKTRRTKNLMSSRKNINVEPEEKENVENKVNNEAKEAKEIDNYKIIIALIIKEKDNLVNRDKYSEVNKYNYPILKTHQMIKKQIEDEIKRKIEEERREKERQRYTHERNLFKEEDVNVFVEQEEKETSESFDEDM